MRFQFKMRLQVNELTSYMTKTKVTPLTIHLYPEYSKTHIKNWLYFTFFANIFYVIDIKRVKIHFFSEFSFLILKAYDWFFEISPNAN